MNRVHQIVNIRTELAPGLPGEAAEYARVKVAAVGRYAPADTEYARVRVSTDGPRRVVARASLDVNGTQVNAEAHAESYQEAVDLLHDKLQHQLAELGR